MGEPGDRGDGESGRNGEEAGSLAGWFCRSHGGCGKGVQSTSQGRAALRRVRKAGQEHPRPGREEALDHMRAGALIFRSWPGYRDAGRPGRWGAGLDARPRDRWGAGLDARAGGVHEFGSPGLRHARGRAGSQGVGP